MSLSCDGAPLTMWTIPANAKGPFVVDSWEAGNTSRTMAYRVVGEAGHQLHTARGCVLQFDAEYAQALCDAANQGLLQTDPVP